ncbi:hypothetical protein SNOG_16359 [Parastagonospora nodorum SN15]|uniref:Uncharacterized protein n=1 Tax=Phaeosphaeria nodorum (strain SN15 / ATCC MYA-4574 / FGSC 10173) TaxID=321614 RepID=Q0TW43_PHANO|nr:hypothetical protein SNOG_16359 [Parastagonospora nodorum SN15]EAT76345.1 hypothetical protein SNOG_16359 [Parastagonospora nodorum SN15]
MRHKTSVIVFSETLSRYILAVAIHKADTTSNERM